MASYTLEGAISPITVLFGNLNFGTSTTPPTPGVGEDTCTNCPDYIKAAVEAPVQDALRNIQTIKKRTALINAALGGKVGGAINGAVQALVDAIPTAPAFDLALLWDTLTCPLTPVALALEASTLTQLDPEDLWKRLQDVFSRYLAQLTADYEQGLSSLEGADLVKIGKAYYEDLKRTEFDADVFAKAVAITAYVQSTCAITYAAGPYAAFDAEASDFDMSGFIPIDTLDAEVKTFMLILEAGEAKLDAWRIVATQPLPF